MPSTANTVITTIAITDVNPNRSRSPSRDSTCSAVPATSARLHGNDLRCNPIHNPPRPAAAAITSSHHSGANAAATPAAATPVHHGALAAAHTAAPPARVTTIASNTVDPVGDGPAAVASTPATSAMPATTSRVAPFDPDPLPRHCRQTLPIPIPPGSGPPVRPRSTRHRPGPPTRPDVGSDEHQVW